MAEAENTNDTETDEGSSESDDGTKNGGEKGDDEKTALSTDTDEGDGKKGDGEKDDGEKGDGEKGDGKTALSTDTDEGKKDGEKKDGKKDGEKDKDEGAPEKYETFTLPEGVEVDDASLKEFGEIARDLGLSQKNAQKLVDLETKRIEAAVKAHGESWNKVVSGWLDEAKADKEIGGDKYDAVLEVGKGAIKKFGTPALVKALDDLGMGNHPEFIRFMYRVGKATGPDETHIGQPGGGGEVSLAERMFPSHGKTT